MAELFLITRGAALGLVLLLIMKVWLDYRHLLVGRLLILLLAGLSAYLVMPFLANQGWIKHSLVVAAISVPPMFWLFALALVARRRRRR